MTSPRDRWPEEADESLFGDALITVLIGAMPETSTPCLMQRTLGQEFDSPLRLQIRYRSEQVPSAALELRGLNRPPASATLGGRYATVESPEK